MQTMIIEQLSFVFCRKMRLILLLFSRILHCLLYQNIKIKKWKFVFSSSIDFVKPSWASICPNSKHNSGYGYDVVLGYQSVTLYKTSTSHGPRYNSILGPRRIVTSHGKSPIATPKAHQIRVGRLEVLLLLLELWGQLNMMVLLKVDSC